MSFFNMSEAQEMGNSPYINTGVHNVEIIGITKPINQDGSEYPKPALDIVIRKTGIESDKDLNDFNKSFRLYYTTEGAAKISNARLLHVAKNSGLESKFKAINAQNIEALIIELNTLFAEVKGFVKIAGEEYTNANGEVKIRPVLPIGNFFSTKPDVLVFDEVKDIKRLVVKADDDASEDPFPFFTQS